MKKKYPYLLFFMGLFTLSGLFPEYASADETYTCYNTCSPVYTNYIGTVTLNLACNASSPASYTGQLTVNGVSTPINTKSCPPTATITANPSTIDLGGNSTLTVTGSNGATDCWIYSNTGLPAEWISPSSGTKTVSPTSNTTYSAYCKNSTGDGASVSATVSIPAPTVSFFINGQSGSVVPSPGYLTTGYNLNMVWSSTNATACTSSGPGFGIPRSLGGTETIIATVSDFYSITCTGPTNPPATKTIELKLSCIGSCGDWSACSKSCGGGEKTASCIATNCSPYTATEACNTNACAQSGWREVAP